MTARHDTQDQMTAEDLVEATTPEQWVRDFADLLIVSSAAGLDTADLMCAGLAKAAEELGGVSHLVNGRPGSWESHLVLRLAMGALGPDHPAMDARPLGH